MVKTGHGYRLGQVHDELLHLGVTRVGQNFLEQKVDDCTTAAVALVDDLDDGCQDLHEAHYGVDVVPELLERQVGFTVQVL